MTRTKHSRDASAPTPRCVGLLLGRVLDEEAAAGGSSSSSSKPSNLAAEAQQAAARLLGGGSAPAGRSVLPRELAIADMPSSCEVR